jgi:hypothetical protein
MNKEPSSTAIQLAAVLYGPKSSLKNLVSHENADDIARDMDALLNRYHRTLSNHLRNTTPKMPGSDGREHSYPDREATKPEYEPVPDPAETETSIPSKESTPSYDDFMERVNALQATGESIFSDETKESKTESMREAISALDDLGEMLRKL